MKVYEQQISIDLGEGLLPITLSSNAEAKSLVERERKYWSFLTERMANQSSVVAQNIKSALTRWDTVATAIDTFEAGSGSRDAVASELNNALIRAKTKLPLSTSREGAAVRLLADELTGEAFNVATLLLFGRAMGPEVQLNNFEHFRGVIAAALYRNGQAQIGSQAAASAWQQMQSQQTQRFASREAELESITADWSSDRVRFQEEAGKSVAAFEERIAAVVRQKNEELDAATKAWVDTQRAYNEQLQLEAPMVYWTKKRERHRALAILLGVICIAYAWIAGCNLISGLEVEYQVALELPAATPVAAYVMLVAKGLFVSVILFWVGRVLVRLFLSQLHLSMDAHERATMVNTYLALTKEGKISDEERPLVLQPLFRSTADGIVKDDASADPFISAIFSRISGASVPKI